jgi:transcriptional regulator with XRE-family HTH domain
MNLEISDAASMAAVIRAARKAQGLRQDDAAGSIGVSESFMVKVENGAERIYWGKLFQVLEGLGVRILVDVPESVIHLVGTEEEKLQRRLKRAANRRADAVIKRQGPRHG